MKLFTIILYFRELGYFSYITRKDKTWTLVVKWGQNINMSYFYFVVKWWAYNIFTELVGLFWIFHKYKIKTFMETFCTYQKYCIVVRFRHLHNPYKITYYIGYTLLNYNLNILNNKIIIICTNLLNKCNYLYSYIAYT